MKILLHKMFGWHYIAFPFGNGKEICRVKVWPSGVKTVSCYGDIYVLNEVTKTLGGNYPESYIELA